MQDMFKLNVGDEYFLSYPWFLPQSVQQLLHGFKSLCDKRLFGVNANVVRVKMMK